MIKFNDNAKSATKIIITVNTKTQNEIYPQNVTHQPLAEVFQRMQNYLALMSQNYSTTGISNNISTDIMQLNKNNR